MPIKSRLTETGLRNSPPMKACVLTLQYTLHNIIQPCEEFVVAKTKNILDEKKYIEHSAAVPLHCTLQYLHPWY